MQEKFLSPSREFLLPDFPVGKPSPTRVYIGTLLLIVLVQRGPRDML